MPKYRHALPQFANRLFLSDGGLETTLVFHDGMDLPCFASFPLLKTAEGTERLRGYYERYIAIARERGLGFVLESATWRANADWAARLGYDSHALADFNRRAIDLLVALRDEHASEAMPMPISGNVGPRGDGYVPGSTMTADEAERYHAEQIAVFAGTEADLVSGFTINYVEEAIGIARAAQAAGMPVVISFTVETDGRLPTGQTLRTAIEAVDEATGAAPAYYMINCAHPTHFAATFEDGGAWRERIRGIRANASKRSHAELDASTDLDDGDPAEFGREHRELRRLLPQLTVLGGCCGTDHRHVEAIRDACAGHAHRAQAA
jgi:S-methylmethionine-dependent homocysteine/selenocysteine methylase